MMRLSLFELSKIWRKKSFILSVCILLAINLFLLWYTNLPDAETPSLSAYKAIEDDISLMTEGEKTEYIIGLKNEIDGVLFVQEIRNLQAMGNEMGTVIAQQKLDANPGVFEQYTGLYQSGAYLLYTDDLMKESTLINELFEEHSKVSQYNAYLESVQNTKNSLSGISNFQKETTDSFSDCNIEKSAADYKKLDKVQIRWQPSKGIVLALESSITDVLLFLGIMLFVGGLITEEKEKRLLYITRATKRGMSAYLFGKLSALLIHTVTLSLVMISSNMLFAAITTGIGDLTASIQSLAPYMESSLSISVIDYILLSTLTKAAVLFCFGMILTAVAIISTKSFTPYFTGMILLAISSILYITIPTYSNLCPLKYLNFIGAMVTEELYGAYLNLNINEIPVSRLTLTWTTLVLLISIGVVLCLLIYLRGSHLELQKLRISKFIRFYPHGNLLRHEAYKLLITNRAVLILLCFAILIGYYGISQEYHPSVSEQYYQKMMLQLEGEFTEQKEQLILAEQSRFDEAIRKISQIDAMVSNGEIDDLTADSMKTQWESVLSFYPSFERIAMQYDRVKQYGGEFIYDTGYLYLLGKQDNSLLICALLLSACMVLSFHNSISVEYSKNSWFLLGTTAVGRKKIIVRKVFVCLFCAAMMSVVPWIFRSIAISKAFPMNSLTVPIQSIPAFENIQICMSVIVFVVLTVFLQMFLIMGVALATTVISGWRKNDMQSLFFGILILVIPLVLKLMGFDLVGWISIYPLYSLEML